MKFSLKEQNFISHILVENKIYTSSQCPTLTPSLKQGRANF